MTGPGEEKKWMESGKNHKDPLPRFGLEQLGEGRQRFLRENSGDWGDLGKSQSHVSTLHGQHLWHRRVQMWSRGRSLHGAPSERSQTDPQTPPWALRTAGRALRSQGVVNTVTRG